MILHLSLLSFICVFTNEFLLPSNPLRDTQEIDGRMAVRRKACNVICCFVRLCHTKEENPGRGWRLRGMLLMTKRPPFSVE